MKCPICVREGLRSKVRIGNSFVTAMGVARYYDEDGKLVVDDPNITTTHLTCSNGHRFGTRTQHGKTEIIEEL